MSYLSDLRKLVGHRPLLSCGATVIVLKGDKILLNLRSDTKTWGIPGGAMELGEKLEETAARELKEETGLEAGTLSFLTAFSGKEFYFEYSNGDQLYSVVHLFQADEISGTLSCIDRESIELEYFSLDDLPELEPRAEVMIDWYKKHRASCFNSRYAQVSSCTENQKMYLNSIYSGLNCRAKALAEKIRSLTSVNVAVGFYNGHFERMGDGRLVSSEYPIPEVEVKGLCDIEFHLEHIVMTAKLAKKEALQVDPIFLKSLTVEVFGVENYLEDYYDPSIEWSESLAKLKNSRESEFFFSFKFPHNRRDEHLLEFIRRIRNEGFYY